MTWLAGLTWTATYPQVWSSGLTETMGINGWVNQL